MVRQSVEASFTPGIEASRGSLLFIGRTGSLSVRKDLRIVISKSGVIGASLKLPPGQYDLIAHTHSEKEPNEQLSFFHVQPVQVSESNPAPLRISLEPAATVGGVLLDSNRSPQREKRFVAGPTKYMQREISGYTHVGRTDAEGRFRLRGLIPRTDYLTEDGISFRAGAAGETSEVELISPTAGFPQAWAKMGSHADF